MFSVFVCFDLLLFSCNKTCAIKHKKLLQIHKLPLHKLKYICKENNTMHVCVLVAITIIIDSCDLIIDIHISMCIYRDEFVADCCCVWWR